MAKYNWFSDGAGAPLRGSADTLFLPFIASSKLQEILSKHNLNPVAAWENLDDPEVKSAVQQAVKPFGGVYIIINLLTGDMYVGSGIIGRIGNRFHQHLFGGSGSKLVWAAVQKYGLSNFAFVIIETVDSVTGVKYNTRPKGHYLLERITT